MNKLRKVFAEMPSEVKAALDGDFLTAIAEQPNEILKCAMYLCLGYLDLRDPVRPVMRRRWLIK